MDTTDRDEKLRLARKKLGKFQKKKKDGEAPEKQSGTATPAESFTPVSLVPVANPLAPLPVAVENRPPSRTSINSTQQQQQQQQQQSVYAPPPPQAVDASSVSQPNRRSMFNNFNSFVLAVTNTAAAIIKPDSDLDDARRQLSEAREERRSRSLSRSPSRAKQLPPRSPSAASPARNTDTVGVFGMASKLFSGAVAAANSVTSLPAVPDAQYSHSQEYQYGVQEGRDFSQDGYYTQQPPHAEYSYGEQQQQQQHQPYDPNAYQYGAQGGYIDPATGLAYPPQANYTQQQHYQQQAYPQGEQYDQNAGYYGDQYYYDQNGQYLQPGQAQDVSNYNPYDQSNYSVQSVPSVDSTLSYGDYPLQPSVQESIPFGNTSQDTYNNNMSWDPSLAPTVSHDAIPGFGGPIQTTASPFDGLSRGRSNSRQESTLFGTGIISHTESNVFRQETVPSPSPRSRKSSLKPKSPSRSRLSSPTTLSRAPAPQAGSPIPFSNSGSIPFSTGGTAGEFPFSGGLQTWPTSPTQIHNASLSRRPSSNMMNYSNQQSASKHNSMSFQATTSPIPERSGFSPQLRTPKRSPRGSRSASALVPPIDTSLYQQQQEAEELYYQQQGQQYQQPEDLYAQDPATATDEGTLQIGADTYTTLVTENDALTRQAAATEQHLTNSIQSRLLIEQRCAQLEAERESVMQDMADLKQIVEGFGNLEQRMREIEERERFLVERESAVHAHEAELQSWATGIEARDREVQDRESVLVTTGSEELDSRMRVRIAEIEKSREGVEALWAEVRQKEAEAAERLREAEALKEESAQALNRVEASVSRVREREEDSKRVSEELTKEREDGLAYVQNQQSLLDVKERELRALELEIESRRREFEEGILAFENDKAALENQFRNSELEQARLAEARNALDVLAERLREDQESLRVREAEIRSREDDFLAQASNMANQEAMQLAELRRNYDEDVQRLQFEAADLQQREAQLAVQSDDLYRLSQEVNDEKTRVEQMKREVEHEKAELTNQAKEIQDAQASLASQQSALDDAVASFTEMKAYIDNSMKENESRIRSEFESLQQAHTALKEREEISMCEIQNERMMVEELQKSIENERQESLRYGAESVLNEELVSKIAMLEKDNADLRQYIDDISALRSQDVNQIAELEESNRQLQNNVLRLTQMIESGTIKKSGSMRSLTPSGPTDQNTKLAVDERVELLERKYQEIAKEESSLKEAAAALVSTANDLKKMWNDVVPAVEELKASGGAIDRSHLWSRRADVDVASSVRSTSETDLLGNKDLVNVIVSLTSTNQNLSKKLDETLTQVQSLQQQQKSSKRSTQTASKLSAHSGDSLRVHDASRRASSDGPETISSGGVTGFNSAHASTLADYDNVSVSADTIVSQLEGTGYYASNETLSGYGTTSTSRFPSQKPAAVYPTARTMTKLAANNPIQSIRRKFGSHDYTDSISEFSEAVGEAESSIKPSQSRIPFTSNLGSSATPTSLPMARIASTKREDSDSSDSAPTPRNAAQLKRATAPASYYSTVRKAPVDRGYSSRAPALEASETRHYTEPESTGNGLSRHVSLEGLRTYFTEKDLEAFSEPAQKVMFGSGVGAATRAATAGAHGRSVADSKYGAKKDVKFSAGTLKAKSDTEGLNGWGSARSTTGLRAVSTTGSRTESIRDAIRARIKERDLGQM